MQLSILAIQLSLLSQLFPQNFQFLLSSHSLLYGPLATIFEICTLSPPLSISISSYDHLEYFPAISFSKEDLNVLVVFEFYSD